jgi:hypothetical protein
VIELLVWIELTRYGDWMKEKTKFLPFLNFQVGERILCRHPFNESKRAYVVPQQVEELLKCYWPGSSGRGFYDLNIFRVHLA